MLLASLPLCAPLVAFLGFGIAEMLMIAMVALLIFGGELPDAMRTLGRAYGKFRRALDEVSKPVREEVRRTIDLPSPRQTARELDAEVRRAGTRKTKKPATDKQEDDATSVVSSTQDPKHTRHEGAELHDDENHHDKAPPVIEVEAKPVKSDDMPPPDAPDPWPSPDGPPNV